MSLPNILVAALALAGTALASPPRAAELTADYSFIEYVRDFQKDYPTPEARRSAEQAFTTELDRVLAHNEAKRHSYSLGINAFSDEAGHRRARGYAKNHAFSHSGLLRSTREELPFEVEPASALPERMDWREHGVVSTTKDQGGCGSCWAFATTECVESHVAIATGVMFDLSPQELVSCMPNDESCGGTGGCAGATCELGFAYFAKEGMLQEYQMGYTSYTGENGNCSAKTSSPSSKDKGPDPPGIAGAVATITGYVKLPENEYLPLLNAVAKTGPIAITVDAAWSGYESGVFEPETYATIDLDHAVLLVGYGTDNATGLDYWLVRNSWSPTWGEGGYIRIVRADPDADGSDICGVDSSPCDGTACAGQCDVNVTACGASGILYDTSYPVGAALK